MKFINGIQRRKDENTCPEWKPKTGKQRYHAHHQRFSGGNAGGLAKEEQVSRVYISTNHIGLYETYGCAYKTQMRDMDGNPSRVYEKRILADPSEGEGARKNGAC